jgi:hypothetical protein
MEKTYGIGEGSKSNLGQRKLVTSEYRSRKRNVGLEAVDGCGLEEVGEKGRKYVQVKSRAGEQGKCIWDNNKHKTDGERRKKGKNEREQPRS